MAVVIPWRKPRRFRLPGQYAGRARFRPRHVDLLPKEVRGAVGRIVEVGFLRVATADEPFAGQHLFLEWRRDDVLDGLIIPEQDLEFVKGTSNLSPAPLASEGALRSTV